jgi:hypothetical protein
MPYRVDSGRQILRDGVRVATVYSKVQTNEKDGLVPADADSFTHDIARTLNLAPLFADWIENVATDDQLDVKVPALDGMTGRQLLRLYRSRKEQWRD